MLHTPPTPARLLSGKVPAIELRRARVRRGRRAFTLVELMVAIALVLVLIIGVNEVFRLTSNTINAGQSLSGATRDQRAVRTTMEDDFSHMAPDGPAIIITNKAVAAFRSREDEIAQAGIVDATNNPVTNDPTRQDLNGDRVASEPGDSNYVTGETATPATPGSRIRRVDTITFFVRRPGMPRQAPNFESTATQADANGKSTAVTRDLVGKALANEAMVTYGHLRLPDNSSVPLNATYFEPGEPTKVATGKTNDNNKYYTQWVLGRGQMLMLPGTAIPLTETRFVGVSGLVGNTYTLSPLSAGTNRQPTPGFYGDLSTTNSSSVLTQVPGNIAPYESLCDLADTSITEFSKRLATYIRDTTVSRGSYTAVTNNGLWFLPPQSTAYANSADGPSSGAAPETLAYRYNGNPFGPRGFSVAANDRNDLAQTLAETAPVLVPRCTNFIVEYAGDFVTQDNFPLDLAGTGPNPSYGLAYRNAPDGEIDFVVYRGVRKIRWYGLPRYTGSGNVIVTTGAAYRGPVVAGTTGTTYADYVRTGPTAADRYDVSPPVGNIIRTETEPGALSHQNVSDVVPLSDILYAVNNRTGNRTADDVAPFEKVVMTNNTVPAADGYSFYDLIAPNSATAAAPNGAGSPVNPNSFLRPSLNYADPNQPVQFTVRRANYVCAWQGTDNKPKLIRITMTLEDPNSRTGTGGQTFEYVFPVP